MTSVVPGKDWLTTWVHLNVAHDPDDVEPGEREDFGELSIFQMLLEEKDFAFSGADVAFTSHDISFLVNHETSLVNVDLIALFILAKQNLGGTVVVTIKDSHDLLKLEGLSVVVEQLGHKTIESFELLEVESLDAILVKNTTLSIDHETLEVDIPTEFINFLSISLIFLETQRVLNVFVEEGAKDVKWIEIVLFKTLRHGNIASLVQIFPSEDLRSSAVVDDVSCFRVN